MERVDRRGPGVGPWAWLLGFLAMGAANAAVAAVVLDGPPWRARALFHAYDLAHFAWLGLCATAIAFSVRRFSRRCGVALLGTMLAALLLGLVVLPSELAGAAGRLGMRTGIAGLATPLAMATALLVPAAELAGRVLARLRLRPLALAVPCVAGPLNQMIYTHVHPAAHLFLAIGGAAVIAGALEGWRLPSRRLAPPRALGIALALSVFLPMPHAPAALMSQISGSALFPFWATLRADDAQVSNHPRPRGEWLESRAGRPPIPPSSPSLLPPSPVVLVLGIDAMRADVLLDTAAAERVPTMKRLADRGIHFTAAYAPSSRTLASFSAVFTGRPMSQLRWSEQADAFVREAWPCEDPSPGFPALLARAGVPTASFAAFDDLAGGRCVVRGFAEHVLVRARDGGHWATAPDLVDALLARIGADPSSSFFAFAHFMDAHFPYDAGHEDDDARARWLGELAMIDAELARLVSGLEVLGVADRTVVVLVADHGEAFGEHGTRHHGSTLYEEVVRVPLVIAAPTISPRRIDDPVSLLDLGPTILDLFGVATPATFMGETLVPALRGGALSTTRPIAIEARPKQAMVFVDGIKAIRDLDNGVLEIYDLRSDPGELDNLVDRERERFDPYLLTLATYFDTHEHRAPGYSVPVR